jgi:hypothetical protein
MDEIFDRLASGGGTYSVRELAENYDNYDRLEEDLKEINGDFDDVKGDLPIEFDSWADVAETLLGWAKEKYS